MHAKGEMATEKNTLSLKDLIHYYGELDPSMKEYLYNCSVGIESPTSGRFTTTLQRKVSCVMDSSML